jgi:hypothetical protein
MNGNAGLKQYLENNYENSVFDLALKDPSPWMFYLHGRQTVQARLVQNSTYSVCLSSGEQNEQEVNKTHIKLVYPAAHAEAVTKLIKTDSKVQRQGLEPIVSPKDRHHIKNKTLFPLMQDREVLFFTLLEGEIIRGLVTAFTRYDLTVSLKGGIPVAVLRHSILDVRDKKGRCYLKTHIKGFSKHPPAMKGDDQA